MKKFLCLFIAIILVLPVFATETVDISSSIALYIGSNNALVNEKLTIVDENEAVVPFVENARTFVPVRFIAEALGLKVDYAESAQAVFLFGNGTDIAFAIGDNKMSINSTSVPIDAEDGSIKPIVQNGRTFLPLRALCEAVGKQVFYDRGLIIIGENAASISAENKTRLNQIVTQLNKLPVVGDLENLKKLVAANNSNTYYEQVEMDGMRSTAATGGQVIARDQMLNKGNALAAQESAPAATATPSAGDDYSKTNVQVQGIDEADIVKTDGNYIYQVNGRRIVIASINPAEQMSITSMIQEDTIEFNPIEMYVEADKLTVISNVLRKMPVIYDSAKDEPAMSSKMIMPYPSGQYYIQCAVYNIADRSKPIRERVFEIEGSYVSSRKIENMVYMVTNKYMSYYYPMQDMPGDVTPLLKDSAGSEDYRAISLADVCYFPNFHQSNYATITSLDTNRPNEEARVETFLGAGNNIYVSHENMYIATSQYQNNIGNSTTVYKFSLNKGLITYLAKESVPGDIINQFSMDEYEGNFRIATTSYATRDFRSSNNLYILDSAMQKRGSITEIAPNETIYSMRFVGSRAYMVTFEKVDPLFVLDLTDIDNPKILGKLKIPGYSNYLHPIDENHVLGFGKDTEVYGGNAYYQGMKMALFDITDVTNPIEKFVEIIGSRGTDSDLLYNHKALLYDTDKELLAFPVTVNTVKEEKGIATQYGEFEFNGAYVYDFNIESGFKLKGKISHLTDEDYLKAGNYFDYQKKIDRILYANGNLFTTSISNIQAHRLGDLQFVGNINIPKDESYNNYRMGY